MIWALAILLASATLLAVVFTIYILAVYSRVIGRIFQTKPLFMAANSPPCEDSEEVTLTAAGGRTLKGAYLPHRGPERRGVVLFGHEFTANRWLADIYVSFLRDDGFDLFVFDFCNHGESESIAGYEPLQWCTTHEVEDVLAATRYLANRPDSMGKIGYFGVSKGGSAGLVVAGQTPFIKAVVTDGAFPTHGTLVHYEMRFIEIYSNRPYIYKLLPRWFYSLVGQYALWRMARKRNVRYPRIESSVKRMAGKPWLVIHGGADNYINRQIIERFIAPAESSIDFWLVKGAKHNGCVTKAPAEYATRVRQFFMEHLASSATAVGGEAEAPARSGAPARPGALADQPTRPSGPKRGARDKSLTLEAKT